MHFVIIALFFSQQKNDWQQFDIRLCIWEEINIPDKDSKIFSNDCS